MVSFDILQAMTPLKHTRLLIQSVLIWVLFWLAGLPHYYQQYSTRTLGVFCTVLSVAISLAALRILLRSHPANRRARAFWCSVYYTSVFAVLDTLYCGIYLGRGAAYLTDYWYLTVFYVTPWLTFMPIERMLRGRIVSQ
jgi:hypothetical protein